MGIYDATERFFTLPVQDFESKHAFRPDIAYRLRLDYEDEDSIPAMLRRFLMWADGAQVKALVIGLWAEAYDGGADEVLQALCAAAPHLPNLKALFVGDITAEECEISWISQGNYQDLLQAYPQLEYLQIRGGNDLQFPPVVHNHLQILVIESGGLPAHVAEGLAASKLPALEHLELWLGDENYGFEGDLALYQKLVQQLRGPNLRYLGLRNAEIADELAQWLSGEAWLEQLEVLDLSNGTLSDVGATALLASPYLSKLQKLNLAHHYLSDEMMEKLQELPCEVDVSEQQEDDEDDDEVYRYVAVGE